MEPIAAHIDNDRAYPTTIRAVNLASSIASAAAAIAITANSITLRRTHGRNAKENCECKDEQKAAFHQNLLRAKNVCRPTQCKRNAMLRKSPGKGSSD